MGQIHFQWQLQRSSCSTSTPSMRSPCLTWPSPITSRSSPPTPASSRIPLAAGRRSASRRPSALLKKGRNSGKKVKAVRIVRHTCAIIHLLTGENPLQVLVDAVITAGPREDSCRVGSAGVVRRQAVDISPLRRVNQALWLLTTGARESAFRNIKSIAECLAEELQNAAKGSSNSYAIKKKDELERVAKANR